MELILWRHAEAEEGSATLPDHKRRLTARGEKQARHMGQWLRSRLPAAAKRVRVLVSPSTRTQQTAHALQFPFEIEAKVGVGATATEVITAAEWPDAERIVVVIGHQPTLGQLAARLMSGTEAEWSIKKGGVWWFSQRVRDDQRQVLLKAVMNPELL